MADPIGPGSAEPEPVVEVIPDRLTPALIARTLAQLQARLVACADDLETHGKVTARVKIAPEGHVLEVVTDEGAPTALGQCVVKKLRSAKFPSTRGGGSFRKTFKL